MKKLIIMSAIAMSGFIYNTADAQIGIHVGFHFGPRRVYAAPPVVVEQAPVYDQSAPVYDDSNNDYYYLPDVDAYYSVNEQCYYYFDGENWISAAYLPGAYRDYDWRNATRYEVRATRPYLNNGFYRARYNGHSIGDWGRANYNNNSYANRGNNGQRFDNGGQVNNGRRFDDGGNRGNTQRFDNRNTQPQQNNGQRTEQRPDNRGQNNNNQPSNQNTGHERENRGNNEHYAQNSPRGGYADRRMAKF